MSAARASTLRATASPDTATSSTAIPVASGTSSDWIEEVRRATDGHLARVLEARRALAATMLGIEREGTEGSPPEASLLWPAVEGLTLRGGKRLRPALLVAAFRAVSPDAIWTRTVPACAALELFQSYLLIHDDWMDGDDARRGGPSVHAHLRDKLAELDPVRAAPMGAALGDALAVLAGDAASALAWELFVEGALACPGGAQAIAIFARIHQEVVLGQEMDLRGARDVARMQRLKTGSYTVTGPITIGAVLAGAEAPALEALRAFGEPLGEAFQIRDDLLGLFGDPAQLGKPVGSDLRAGRRNALLRESERLLPAEERARLERVVGRSDATDEEVAEVAEMLSRAGIRHRVEERLGHLLREALEALDAGPLAEPGLGMLRALAMQIVDRDR